VQNLLKIIAFYFERRVLDGIMPVEKCSRYPKEKIGVLKAPT